ncbi:uncharacterized protein K02A2.6-like [Uranotaenia lowii]|uniref:uncharacterized protein K02A2.6-like n=1 Tax=Uranotaenia lowii TaxID=190385 RepID=UPI002479E732|nr:uncharacterized protein K02A2.6-like [Uranotaenia lowii]
MIRSLGMHMQPFDYASHTDDAGIEWQKWIRSFETMIRASRIEDEDWKKDLLLHYAGPNVQQLFDTLPEVPGTEMRGPLLNIEHYTPNMTSYEEAKTKLNAFFLPKENSTYERHLLRQMKQRAGESIDSFTIRLRVQAERCGFDDRMEENIKDQIIQNCQSAVLRRDLLKRGDASLEEILSVAKIFETVAQQEKSFVGAGDPKPNAPEVNRIEVKSYGKRTKFSELKQPECHRCGYFGHFAKDDKCPAKGQQCKKCGGKDHFWQKCHSKQPIFGKKKWDGNPKFKRPDATSSSSHKNDESNVVKHIADKQEEYIFHLTTSEGNGEINCEIGGVKISAIIDSGSKYNLMSQKNWEQLKEQKVIVSKQQRDASVTFKAYGGQSLELVGVFTASLKLGNSTKLVDFYVVKGDGKVLIGRDTATAMDVLKIGIPVNEVEADVKCEKLGTIKDIVVDIPIKADAVPVVQPYRRIPVALEKMVDKKLNELLEQGVIEAVNEPAKWISPVVVVPKAGGGDVRICVDMRRANEAVERENHPLPTFEDFLPHLAKAKFFSRLDVKNAFHQVEISERSRDITTFITRKGLFRYTRLMFGINCAPELFQKTMEQVLSGCEGCLVFIDDIIVHNMRLKKVLQRLREWNVVLNETKCIYGVSEMRVLGHILSAEGIKPDEDKLESIRRFREPKSGEEVRSFLGLVNYISKFIPDVATLTFPLRQLTVQKHNFVWEPEHQKAFEKLKDHMVSPTTLGYFNDSDRTQLVADASPVGLGAVLIQMNEHGPRIIAYASKSLSDVERRYAQIEKEALALVWAVERFHFYLFGRSFELITDHKPLEVIFGPKSKPCARIERWVVRLQSYKATVVYRPGKSNIADPLSRLAITDTTNGKTFDEYADQYVAWVVSNALPVALKISEIEQASEADSTIQSVRIGMEHGDWTEDATPFKLFVTELSFVDKILLRGTRIVMPDILRTRTLDLAHEGHPGMTIMKQRMRAKVWWPKMDIHVERYVKSCRGCMLVAAPPRPEPMKRRELPSGPWQHVAIDFLGPLPSGHYLFVVVDYFSRYIEVEIMTKTDTTETVKRLNVIFSRFGLPFSITADNGPQFSSEEFRSFCDMNNIKLISTTPYWPQQNGEVERQNRSLLKRLMISQATNADWVEELHKYLLMYRSSPHSTTKRTPSEMLLGYNIRDRLPSIFQPKDQNEDEETVDRDKTAKEIGKQYADKRRNAKPSSISEGDTVLIKKMSKTNKLAPNFEPKTYKVLKRKGGDVIVSAEESGVKYRRHISHLQRIPDDFNAASTSSHIPKQDSPTPRTPSDSTGNEDYGHSRDTTGKEPAVTKRVIRKPTYMQDYVQSVVDNSNNDPN